MGASNRQPNRHDGGISLIELLVAITLLSLAVTLGVPSLARTLDQQRLDNAGDRLTNSIRLTRETAITRNQAVVMAPLAGNWNGGWRVFVDNNQNGQLDADDILLQEDQATNITTISATGELARYLRYNPLGESERLDGGFLAGTLRLCPVHPEQPGRRLIINRVGRLRSESAVLAADICSQR